MEQRFNKPRVFLSHSKKDSAFIEKLADDLRKCQIEPWLDTYEIRHGKSWLDSIFEYGLPTCDAILVYFTEASMASAVVKKEMDAGVLQTLNDNNVAFLPYVNDATIRPSLRADIQALQTPEWNDENYSYLLPRVVAEIWRSYLERTVASATKDEHVKRLEAELELEKTRNHREDIFSPSENGEFGFIWNFYNKMVPMTLIPFDNNDAENKAFEFSVNLATVIACMPEASQRVSMSYEAYGKYILESWIEELAKNLLDLPNEYKLEGFPNLGVQLRTYGLIELDPRLDGRLTEKFYRFRHWLTYHQKLPESIVMEIVKND